MSRSTVFWDTRLLVGAFRLPKERGTGDVPPQRGRGERKHLSIGHRLFAPAAREANEAGGGANFQAIYRRIARGDRHPRIDEVRGCNADPFSEPTPICNRFEF